RLIIRLELPLVRSIRPARYGRDVRTTLFYGRDARTTLFSVPCSLPIPDPRSPIPLCHLFPVPLSLFPSLRAFMPSCRRPSVAPSLRRFVALRAFVPPCLRPSPPQPPKIR